MFLPPPDKLPVPVEPIIREPSRKPAPAVTFELLEVIFRYKWLILITFVTAVLSTAFWLLIRYDTYETTAKVLVRFSRDEFNPRDAVSSTMSRLLPVTRPDLPTEIDMIGSYAVIAQVVDQLHLDRPTAKKPPPESLIPRVRYELRELSSNLKDWTDSIQYSLGLKERLSPRESAIVDISDALSADTTKESSIFSIKLKTKFKEGAAAILNTLVDVYRQRRMSVEQNPEQTAFLDKAVSDQRQELQGQEDALEKLKAEAGIFGDLTQQIDQENRRVLDAETQLKNTAGLVESTKAKVQVLTDQLRRESPTRLESSVDQRNALLNYLNERRTALAIERQRLLGKFTEDQPQVTDVNEQIAKVDQLISETSQNVQQSKTVGVNPNFSDLQKETLTAQQNLAAAEAAYRSQEGTLNGLIADRQRLQQADTNYQRLSRQVALNEESYKFQKRNSDEFKAGESMSARGVTEIAVVDPAVDPIVPVGYRKSYILGGAMGGSFVLALGLAFFFSAIDASVSNPRILTELTGMTPLAILPPDRSLTRRKQPSSTLERELLLLASELDAMAKQENISRFSFLACHAGAGVSTIVASLARTLSSDLERRVLHMEISAASENAVSMESLPQLEAGQGSALTSLCGIYRPSWPAFEISGHLSKFTSQSQYDLVLFDVDSRLPSFQQIGVAQASQCVILVCESEQTSVASLHKLIAKLTQADVNIGGIVLNKQRRFLPRALVKYL